MQFRGDRFEIFPIIFLEFYRVLSGLIALGPQQLALGPVEG
jgi:hypothetical protein